MTTTTTPGREPRTIVELVQPRCAHSFGTGSCTATGTPKCYNTYSTCRDLANYDGSAQAAWRFTSNVPHDDQVGVFDEGLPALADGYGFILDDGAYVTDDGAYVIEEGGTPRVLDLKTNGIPCVTGVSTAGNKINPGANRDGESPFGVTGRVTVQVQDIPWDDHVGDPYIADRDWYEAGRPLPIRAGFWRLFNARNAYLNDMTLNIYDGYQGQTLAAMRKRTYTLENISGPSFDGSATLTGVDPLKAVNDDKHQYPPASDLELAEDISASATSIQVFGTESDLTSTLGNDGVDAVKIGDELISYDSYTDDGDNYYTLTDCERGLYGTTADSHSDGDAVQRIARFDLIKPWVLMETILTHGDAVPAAYIPTADWETECGTYIPSSRFSRILHDPTGVRKLAGQICQQGLFYVWWAEFDQEVKLLAIRPPSDAVATLTDDTGIQDGIEVKADHEQRITRVVIYYEERDPLGGDTSENFARKYTVIDTDTEGAGVTPVIKTIFARWVRSRVQASQIGVRLLIRYKSTPRFISLTIDAKDRTIGVGDLTDVTSRYALDSEGNIDTARWQVISAKEVQAGHSYALDLQTYTFLGNFGVYMDAGSPDYADATDAEKEDGAWYADADGEITGDEGYQYQ